MEGDEGRQVKAVGEGSAAIGGDTKDSTIIPGDHNLVGQSITQIIYYPKSDPSEGLASKGREKAAFSPFDGLRRLSAYYWRPILTVFALAPSLLKVLHVLGLKVTVWPEQANSATQGVLIGLGLMVLVVIRFPRVAFAITRWIVPPPPSRISGPHVFRGPDSYSAKEAGEFYGRIADGDDCWDRIRRKPFFVLEGESGCGKSSLLNVVLLPTASQDFHVVSCRCGEDPFGKLRSALLDERYEPGRRYGKPALKEAIESAIQRSSNPKPRSVLVCIDQFEELFVTVKDQVRRQFFMALKEAIEEDRLRLVLAIRTDFSDLVLHARLDVDPDNTAFAFDRGSYHTLRSFSAEDAEAVLRKMLDHEEIHGGDPLKKQENQEFARVLTQGLLRPPGDKRLSPEDENRVLPVEIQMVGWTYESILGSRFSAAQFRRLGGKAGLYRRYIEDSKDYVFRKTGIDGATSLRVLRRLISPAGTKWEQSVASVAPEVGLSVEQVDRALEAFAEGFLVRRLPLEPSSPAGEGPTVRRYELMHEHLVQLLEEAPQRELQRLRNAEARLRFWRDRTKNVSEPQGDIAPQPRRPRLRAFGAWLASFFAQPIPIGETLGLWRYARGSDDDRLLRRNLRGFLMRVLTVSVLFGVPWAGWVYYERTPAYQMRYVIAQAPDTDLARSSQYDDGTQTVFREWLAALVRVGQTDSAMAAADKVINPYLQSLAYAAIAEAAAKADDRGRAAQAIESALVAAGKVTEPFGQSRAYAAIAEAAAKAGLIESILVGASKVTDPSGQSRAYAAIAAAAAEAGSSADAERAEKRIPEGYYDDRSKARAAIARALAREGRFYEARVYCEPCERLDKLRAYTTILEEYAKRYHPAIKRTRP